VQIVYSPFVAGNTVHLGNGRGQKTTERTSKRGSREEEGRTESKFLALVPTAARK
jgi:hypothetical protein